ncbi:MAG TPA: ribosome silencing factor [Candidatus Limnocylindria bacterium]|nr:ribosome silencing factor [Candidatus Limnocylindria bacterium]
MTDLAEAAQETNAQDPGELAHRIVNVASDKKASDIVLLRTAEITTMADYFVIASGRSETQVQALSKAIVDELRDEGIRPIGVEGRSSARWVLLDYGSVIVHLFAPEEREYYGLERLWSEATQVARLV